MRKMPLVMIVVILFLLASSVAAITTNKSIVEEDCECEDNYDDNVIWDGKGAWLKEFPPMKEEQLLIKDKNPQLTRTATQIPSQFSWLDYNGDWTTPVKDQGNCGSCWAFSALGALEGAINIASGYPTTDIDLSEQYVLSCLSAAGSCSGGWMHEAIDYIKRTDPGSTGNGINGCTIESCMPYQASSYIPCSSKCADWDYYTDPPEPDNKLWQIDNWGWSTFQEDNPDHWDIIKSWIMDYGPVSIDFYVSNSWRSFFNNYHSPNDVYQQDDYGITNHGIVVCGWVDDASIYNGGYWIMKNSWGTAGGYGGFFNIAYGCNSVGTRCTTWVTATEWPQEPEGPGGPGAPPIIEHVFADFSWGPSYPKLGDEITFNDDSTGPVILREWDFNDDGIIDSTARKPKWTYYVEGDHPVHLTVWNSPGLPSSRTFMVSVKEIWPPVAVSNPSYYGGEDNVVYFDGRSSYDVDGSIRGYAWDFDSDGVTDSTENRYTYTFPNQNGEHLVTLTVTDDEGATDTAEIEVKIDLSVKPETTVEFAEDIGAAPSEWYDNKVGITLIATDWSGIRWIYYNLNNQGWEDKYCQDTPIEYVFDELSVNTHGTHTIEFYSIDKFGNQEDTHTEQIKIDLIPPTLTITGVEDEGVYVSDVTINLASSDADSGISKINYRLGSNTYTSTEEVVEFIVSDTGYHSLYVEVEDNAGNKYESDRIDFSIKRGPSKPKIEGPHNGVPGEEYEFKFKSTDFYGDDISYYIKWGDTTTTGWTEFVPSGTEITEYHTWTTEDTFTVEVQAKNTEGAKSEWSTWGVSTPKPRFHVFNKFIGQFPILEKLLSLPIFLELFN